MSKIEEMAKKYCQGSSFEDACMEKPAYIAGAKAVLEEIEKVLYTTRLFNDTKIEKLKELVKQLKG